MASQMSSIPRPDVTALVRQVQSTQLYNRQLSSVCQVNGLKSTGVKAELQQRIITLIQETANSNDISRFYQVRQSIINAFAQRSPAKGSTSRATSSSSSVTHPPSMHHMSMPMTSYNTTFSFDPLAGSSNAQRQNSRPTQSSLNLTFKSSPFYRIEAPVSDVRICEVMTQHRNSVNIPLSMNDHPSLQQCVDKLKVNGGDIKANLRGLKNKPGSTRPVDITNALRLRPNYVNNVDFTYALTNKKFYVVVYLCSISTVSELAATISTRRRIPKESVIEEINQKAQDPDVVATSQVLSLKCPLSYMRLTVPCRGLSCSHIQCFDAVSYLQLQEQGPQWLCPICNKAAPFEQLAVDEYVKDILDSTPKSLESVIIEPNGNWILKAEPDAQSSSANTMSMNDYFLESEGFEISEIDSIPSRINEATPSGEKTASQTPGASRANGTGTAKRPAPVIDLTLSSDEDEEPIQRPSKRQNSAVNGYSGPSFGFSGLSPNGYS